MPARFELITRHRVHGRVLDAIDTTHASGVPSVKLNCVVMRGVNEDEVVACVRLTETRSLDVPRNDYRHQPASLSSAYLRYVMTLEGVLQTLPSTPAPPPPPPPTSPPASPNGGFNDKPTAPARAATSRAVASMAAPSSATRILAARAAVATGGGAGSASNAATS